MKKLLLIGLLIVGCEKESETIINEAKKEAENIRLQADRIKRTTERKLHTIFDELEKYTPYKVNQVDKKYIDSFKITNYTIAFTLKNETEIPTQPNFKIVFVKLL